MGEQVGRKFTIGLKPTKKEVIRMKAYCMKCKTKREMKNPVRVTMKNGRKATKGTCPVCSTKMFRIGA